MFVSSADRNLLLLIAPELRLAPLHALHDTSYVVVVVTTSLSLLSGFEVTAAVVVVGCEYG